MRRELIAVTLAIVWVLALVATAFASGPSWTAEEPQNGNLFLCVQHALAAEGRYQSPANLLDMARAVRGKGACYRDPGWLSTWRLTMFVMREEQHNCIWYYSCQGFFLYETIPPDVREPLAIAAHVALTEDPPVARYHFMEATQPLYAFFNDARSCPNVYEDGRHYYEREGLRFC